MKNRRKFLLTLIAGLVAGAVVITPVIAEEFFGFVTKVDAAGKKLTVVKKDDTEVEVTTTDSTELASAEGEHPDRLREAVQCHEEVPGRRRERRSRHCDS